MLRLTQQQPTDRETVIRVNGRLDAETMPELCALLRSSKPTPLLTLDLSGLISLDADARSTLMRLRRTGCKLVGGSLYVRRLLEEVQP